MLGRVKKNTRVKDGLASYLLGVNRMVAGRVRSRPISSTLLALSQSSLIFILYEEASFIWTTSEKPCIKTFTFLTTDNSSIFCLFRVCLLVLIQCSY